MEKPDKTNDFLAKWVNGELSEEELYKFKESKDYVLYKTILEGTELLDLPEVNKKELFNRIQVEKQKEVKVKSLIPKWVYVAAACVALFFGYTFFFNQNVTFESNYGEQLAITLPDGSEVMLNAKSTLYFKKENWKGEKRNVFLEGEGFFKVKKGSAFTVTSGSNKVSVLGTQFNIIANPDFYEVGCYEGKVKVENKMSSKVITKGEGVRDVFSKLEDLRINEEIPSWIGGESSFVNTPLKQVISALEKQYNIGIRADKINQNQRYTGTFTHDNLEIALLTVFDAMDIKFIFVDKTIIVLSTEINEI